MRAARQGWDVRVVGVGHTSSEEGACERRGGSMRAARWGQTSGGAEVGHASGTVEVRLASSGDGTCKRRSDVGSGHPRGQLAGVQQHESS